MITIKYLQDDVDDIHNKCAMKDIIKDKFSILNNFVPVVVTNIMCDYVYEFSGTCTHTLECLQREIFDYVNITSFFITIIFIFYVSS